MPQLFMIIDRTMEHYPIVPSFDLIIKLVKITEEIFDIEGKRDVAFTAVVATRTFNEAPIQLEVQYTAGKDEYGTGQIFDPNEKTRKKLAFALKEALQEHFKSSIGTSISVWIKPYYNSIFI